MFLHVLKSETLIGFVLDQSLHGCLYSQQPWITELVHHSGRAKKGFSMLKYNKGKAINSNVITTQGLLPEMQPTEYASIIGPMNLSLGVKVQGTGKMLIVLLEVML